VSAAGGQFDPKSGAIDMTAAAADPTALLGKLPGEMGVRHDQAVGGAAVEMQQAGRMAQEAGASAHAGIQGLIQGLIQDLSNPAKLFGFAVKAAMAVVKDLIKQGVGRIKDFTAQLTARVAGALSSIGAMIGALVQSLVGPLMGRFTAIDADRASTEQAGDQAAGSAVGQAAQAAGTQLSGAKGALLSALMSIAAAFSGRAGDTFGKAQKKAQAASKKVAAVQSRPMDLGVGTGTFEVDPAKQAEFDGVTGAIAQMSGGADQLASDVSSTAGQPLAKAADHGKGAAKKDARKAADGATDALDAASQKQAKQVAKKRSEAEARAAAFKKDPIGSTVKAVGDALKGLFKKKK
jgi:hypothetical protein